MREDIVSKHFLPSSPCAQKMHFLSSVIFLYYAITRQELRDCFFRRIGINYNWLSLCACGGYRLLRITNQPPFISFTFSHSAYVCKYEYKRRFVVILASSTQCYNVSHERGYTVRLHSTVHSKLVRESRYLVEMWTRSRNYYSRSREVEISSIFRDVENFLLIALKYNRYIQTDFKNIYVYNKYI